MRPMPVTRFLGPATHGDQLRETISSPGGPPRPGTLPTRERDLAHPFDEIVWAVSEDALASLCARRARARLRGTQDSGPPVERSLARALSCERNPRVTYDGRGPARPVP